MPSVLEDDVAFNALAAILNDAFADVRPTEVPQFGALRGALLKSPTGSIRAGVRTRDLPHVGEAALLALHLLSGTLAAIEVWQARKRVREEQRFEDEIRQVWIEALIKAGMSPELAAVVPVNRCPDMIKFLMNHVDPGGHSATPSSGKSAG